MQHFWKHKRKIVNHKIGRVYHRPKIYPFQTNSRFKQFLNFKRSDEYIDFIKVYLKLFFCLLSPLGIKNALIFQL